MNSIFTVLRQLLAITLATLSLSAAALDVNQANQAELETIKGIGPALSGRIIDARKTSAFKDWADMVERVPGVGPANAQRFSQAGLTVGGVAYSGPAATPAAPAKVAKTQTESGTRTAAARQGRTEAGSAAAKK